MKPSEEYTNNFFQKTLNGFPTDRKRSLKTSIKSLMDSTKLKEKKSSFFFKKNEGKENIKNNANGVKNPSLNKFKVRRYSTASKPNLNFEEKLALFKKKNSTDATSKRKFTNSATLLENYKKAKWRKKSSKPNSKDIEDDFLNVYAANTNNGRCRSYNEDRVSIILNIISKKEKNDEKINKWNAKKIKRISFFGVYDGHAGHTCADFLKDNLHNFIANSKSFRHSKSKAIFDGLIEAENEFKKQAVKFQTTERNLDFRSPKLKRPKILDNSGSCAILCLFEGEIGHVANVGDSRLILSRKKGKEIEQVSNDHKPESEQEKERILRYGGAITRKQSLMRVRQIDEDGKMVEVDKTIDGPFRVNPGGLSVSRTIGDFQSKLTELGGNPMCVIPVPELSKFTIEEDTDFMVIACDGVFDVLSNEDVVGRIWRVLREENRNLEELAEIATQEIIDFAMEKESTDNLTVVVVLFKNWRYYRGRDFN